MIVSTINADGWGTDPMKDTEGNLGGCQINMKSGEQIWQIPWATESLMLLIKELAEKGLTTEQRRELAPVFTNGLFLPGQDFEQGPQG